jgi:phosphoribosylglycinamide formyltransferase-1
LGVLKDISIKALICNHPGIQVVRRARNAEITTFEIEGVTGKKFGSREEKHQARLAFDNECVSISKTLNIAYIVLAGFDQILSKSFTNNFPYRILNIHPAYDLKLFGGKSMVGLKVHETVLGQKMNYSGCTVHFVTGAVDQGPVILKKRVQVLPNDTPEKLESRILEQEHLAYPEALQMVVDGRVYIPSSGNQCYVDRYGDNWDIEWSRRQEAYIDHVKKMR